MDLLEAMRTTGTCRRYDTRDVPDAVLYRAFEAARFGPQGGNRQAVRWVVVRDPELRERLQELYLRHWDPYHRSITEGQVRVGGSTGMLTAADQFARTLAAVPALVVVCARIEDLQVTDVDTGRVSVVGGASIYPLVQNLCLALRDQGVATAVTTLLCREEAAVRALLGIADDHLTAATLAIGYPARGFPTKLRRLPVEEVAYADRFGSPLFDGPLPGAPGGPDRSTR
ncbi:nitroreductase family protein [Blastococcus mobilis]|uniref:Nitroreductase n=1 Tax=Blastococcus mobilis TaxID=1938746 RepID=A0A238ZBP0_9ACTN|nr:nitroreductase family protein [Blastococcus mobilis]SNR80767.1 Nitroreductase [Blastococcus mobilis]